MLYYKEYGNPNGKPVIFIHGGFASHKAYEKQFEILSEYRNIFVDLPNCGESLGYEKFTFDAAIEGVMELIDVIAPKETVILIGHSYGGLVVKGLLEKIPQRVEKAVIGSANLKRSPMYRLYTSGLGAFLTWMKNRDFYQKESVSLKLIYDTQKSAWKHFKLPDGARLLQQESDIANNMDAWKQIPVLLLYADGDIPDIQASMKLWKELLPNAELKQFSNVGHAFFREHPELVNPVVEAFVRK